MSLMANSPAEIIQQLLADLGVATIPPDPPAVVPDWAAYSTNEPNVPDNVITVTDTTGQSDGRSMIDGKLWQHHGFQVRVRGTDHQTTQAKISAIRVALSESVSRRTVHVTMPDNSVNGYFVACVARIGQIIPLGTDGSSSKRHLFTLNALLAVYDQ